MNLVYGVKDRPKFGQTLIFALQQLLAILAATIAVPTIIGSSVLATGEPLGGMSQSAALFGAGVGTLVYLCFTKFKSPVFLGSSFAFLGSMFAAFAGAVSAEMGYMGLLLGAVFAGLVYVVLAIIVKVAGVKWINRLMPPVVIGPTVAIIGLSLAGNAIGNSFGFGSPLSDGYSIIGAGNWSGLANLVCALVTLLVVIWCSVKGNKMVKLIPFILGILAGYACALVFTLIGNATGKESLKILDFSAFSNMKWVPDFTFLKAFKYQTNIVCQFGSHLF